MFGRTVFEVAFEDLEISNMVATVVGSSWNGQVECSPEASEDNWAWLVDKGGTPKSDAVTNCCGKLVPRLGLLSVRLFRYLIVSSDRILTPMNFPARVLL